MILMHMSLCLYNQHQHSLIYPLSKLRYSALVCDMREFGSKFGMCEKFYGEVVMVIDKIFLAEFEVRFQEVWLLYK